MFWEIRYSVGYCLVESEWVDRVGGGGGLGFWCCRLRLFGGEGIVV